MGLLPFCCPLPFHSLNQKKFFSKLKHSLSLFVSLSLCLSLSLSVSLSLFVCLYLFLSHSFPKSMCGIAKCVCMGEWTGEDDRDRDEGVLVIEHIPIDLVCVVRLP